jgi:outer membrane protein assembly factor BamE
MRTVLGAACLGLVLGGCATLTDYGYFYHFGVYKLDINQGNYITVDQVDKLKVGQTRPQVRLVLGTPLLTDPFHANRWDYPYLFTRQGRTLEHRQLTLYFVDDKLARWEGDEAPPPPAVVAAAGGGDSALDKSLSTAPKTGETNWLQDLLKKLGWWE